jgi:hypothetical protein
MRRTALLVTGLVALISIFGSRSAHAQYGAIAYDSNNCAWGRAWNYQTPQLAAATALAECANSGCKVMAEIGPHQCGSLASTANCKGWGWATRPTLAEAQAAALQECVGYNAGECIARVGDCDQ